MGNLNSQTEYEVGMKVIVGRLSRGFSSFEMPRLAVVGTVIKLSVREVRVAIEGQNGEARFLRTGSEYGEERGRFLVEYSDAHVKAAQDAVARFEVYRRVEGLRKILAEIEVRHMETARLETILVTLETLQELMKPREQVGS